MHFNPYLEPFDGNNFSAEDDEFVVKYHRPTNTYWISDLEWESGVDFEPTTISFINLDSKNIYKVNRLMSREGFMRLYNPTDELRYMSGEWQRRIPGLSI